jgi:hypothetical protein
MEILGLIEHSDQELSLSQTGKNCTQAFFDSNGSYITWESQNFIYSPLFLKTSTTVVSECKNNSFYEKATENIPDICLIAIIIQNMQNFIVDIF